MLVDSKGKVLYFNFAGNLAKAEECRCLDGSDTREFNLWTSRDCAETEFENGNKTWFYFSVCTPQNYTDKILRYSSCKDNSWLLFDSCMAPLCRFNIRNLNRQYRLYQQGLTPITKTVPGRGSWERLRGRTDYEVIILSNSDF